GERSSSGRIRMAACRAGSAAAAAPVAQLATLADGAPDGDAWCHEIKYDGYRLLAHVEAGVVRLSTRKGQDWTDRFPAVAEACRNVGARRALLDGEVAVVRDDGVTSFQALQNVLNSGGAPLYFVFDLLELDGDDLRGEALELRKSRLL